MGKRSKRKPNYARMLLLAFFITAILGIVSNGENIGSYFNYKLLGTEKPPYYAGSIVNPSTDNTIQITKEQADIYKGELILVNNNIPYRFMEEKSLVSLYDYKNAAYQVKDKNVLLSKDTIEPLNSMLDDFYQAHGPNSLIVVSGYRTNEFQQALYEERVSQEGAVEAAKWVAQSGGSEHHTGIALDFSLYSGDGSSENYDGSGKYRWINNNAYEYGFIVRYDENKKDITEISYEPWHFRYVGLPHSYIINNNNFCFEEYIDYLRGYEYGENHLEVRCNGAEYEIYFTKDTNIYVPKEKEYQISGNNIDGFIVTVRIS